MATGRIVTKHYAGTGGLGDRIYERLRSLGFEERNPLSPKDTAALDQFHVGGFEATEKLAQLLCPPQGSYVLDVGSGLGGPSRYLAAKYGCRVVGIDITEEYCGIASKLAEHMGLQDLVEYRVGDARDLPFSDESFDVVWTQHVSMNRRKARSVRRDFSSTQGRRQVRCTRCRPRCIRTHSFPCAVGSHGRDELPPNERSHAKND
jgi:SAM-dependent methyltransferase